MQTLLEQLFPNVMASPDKFWESVWATVVMTGWAGALMFVIGLCLGLLMVVLKPGGILACPVVYQILDKVVNLIRSIPFVILIALLMYVTKAIMGTRIGIRGVIVPLVVGSAPFFSRQVEAALSDIPAGLVEAAKAMGSGPLGIIFRVYLKEGAAAIARGTTITLISLIGLTAMAGYVGAGGQGDYSITYGYNYNRMDIVWASVIAIVVLVCIIQMIGTLIAKRNTH